MSDWGDLQYVLETVRQGGLSGAARVLGVNHATVSRRIAVAEEQLGAVLFDRLPAGYAPTPAGLDAARAAEQMEAAQNALALTVGARDERLAGPVSMTAPQLLVERVLGDILADFTRRHPDIEVSLKATNEPLNLSQREADIAVRISDTPGETLVGTRVSQQRAAVFVSKAYMKQLYEKPDARLHWIRFTHWPGPPEQVKRAWPERRIILSVDDMLAAIGAVRAGLGATRMPCFLGDSDPLLTRLPGVELFDYPSIWVLTHRDMGRVKRIETFKRFLAAGLRVHRARFMGDFSASAP